MLREVEHGPRREIPLEELTLMAGLNAEELAIVREQLRRRELDPDEVLFREGESGDRLYVLRAAPCRSWSTAATALTAAS